MFVVPFGPTIPLAAILIAVAILAGATSMQLRAGTGALAAGAVLYVTSVRGMRAANIQRADRIGQV
jgi:hypothetical protein